jgi:dTDP-4-dehydrorhamnose 3,5-epimerase
VQDNQLVRVLVGKVLDVVVDIRRNSPAYGKVFSIELSAENKRQLYIPKGFAHGFSVLSDIAEVLYKCDNFYHKESEGGIIPDDKDLNIDWQVPVGKMLLSEKDKKNSSFADIKVNFEFAV